VLHLNISNLYNLLRDFYTLTSIRIVIFDADYKELMAYPSKRVDFCEQLRLEPKKEASCHSCDIAACKKCAKTKSLVQYRCHAGLVESVVPVCDRSGVLAYVMFGQVLPAESCLNTKEQLIAQNPQLIDAISRLSYKSSEELQAAGTVLQAITSYMMSNRWVIPEKSEFIRHLDRYIAEHLKQGICVTDVSAALQIRRSKLYEMSKEYLGCGLAEYIRRQRIWHAKQLLLKSNLSITDIASEVGFLDYNHFSRVFKAITGASARTFRKNHTIFHEDA